MKNLWCCLAVVALLRPVTLAQPTGTPIGKGVIELVVPILDLRCKSLKNPNEKDVPGTPSWRMGELLYKLSRNQTAEADEALAVLLGYYLGESNDYDLLRDVTVRGGRMLRYLRKYRDRPAVIPGRQYPDSMRPDGKFSPEDYDEAIAAIQQGKVLNDED